MKIKKTIGFPTQGELIKFSYKMTGILPTKYGPKGGIDETKKKTLQTSLLRIAAEEGKLNDKFVELIQQFRLLVSEHISNQKIIFAIGEVLFDVLDVYISVLRSDGTYLDKKETMKWFVSTYLINRVVFSVKKHILRLNVAADNLSFPDDKWFLPSINNEEIEYPLAKTMRWVYELCETSRSNFHYPDKSSLADYARQEQNLESAINWLGGKNIPSLAILLSNFDFSFDALEKCKDIKNRKIISEDKRESIRIALLIARTNTFIFKEILENYGLSYLKEVCNQYSCYSSYLSEEIAPIKSNIETHIESQQLAGHEIDMLWYEQIPKYFLQLDNKQSHVSKEIESYILSCNVTTNINPLIVRELVARYGSWTVLPTIDFINRQQIQTPPENFAEFLFKGLALKNNAEATEEQIESFKKELDQSNVSIRLPWLFDWVQGAHYYRKEKYEIAYPFFKKAFETARYCAGKNQYKLVNQYIELAAKNNKWTDFKKGIEWAKYIGIEIRWLREKQSTKENLEFVYTVMKKANYSDM